jgi:DNA adenine methylase
MGGITRKNKYVFQGLELSIQKKKLYFLEESMKNNLLDVSDYLNDTKGKIYNKDYTYVLDKAKKGDFVFLDPPYIEDHEYNFQYNIGEDLNINFINDLYTEVKILDKKGVKWLMTQAETPYIKKIFKEYKIKKFKVYRINKKIYVNELIIMNY